MHVVKYESFLQVGGVIIDEHDQTFSRKVLKVTSLQYLYNIWKKKVKDGVHFLHADKHQSFYKLALSFLIEEPRHVQSKQNKKL